MIRSTGELMFGQFFENLKGDQLFVSKKFVDVNKILSADEYFYLLSSDANIYMNSTITDDNFTLIETTDAIKFIDMTLSFDKQMDRIVLALSTDGKLYEIKRANINIITNILNLSNIRNIYSAVTNNVIIKTHDGTYYNHDNYLGEFDSVYFVAGKLLIVKNCEIIQSESLGKKISYDMVQKIPEGSFLRFYSKVHKTISITPLSDFDSILYSTPIIFNNISICCKTGNIYNTRDRVVIPNLCNCLISRDYNFYSRTKRAIN